MADEKTPYRFLISVPCDAHVADPDATNWQCYSRFRDLPPLERIKAFIVEGLADEQHLEPGFNCTLEALPDDAVVVPREPTAAMLGAAPLYNYGGHCRGGWTCDESDTAAVWRDMIAAAPTYPEPSDG